jgi:hypothetical protein
MNARDGEPRPAEADDPVARLRERADNMAPRRRR